MGYDSITIRQTEAVREKFLDRFFNSKNNTYYNTYQKTILLSRERQKVKIHHHYKLEFVSMFLSVADLQRLNLYGFSKKGTF